jgi:hypothetical protein
MGRRFARRLRHQALSAIGLGAVAVVLTGLSLTHLAHGITIVTHAPAWEGWSMAIGVDLGFIGLELANIVITNERVRVATQWYRTPAIMGTLILSAIMNAFAFSAGAEIWTCLWGFGIGFGLVIPMLVYALTNVGAKLYLDATRSQ